MDQVDVTGLAGIAVVVPLNSASGGQAQRRVSLNA